MKKTIGAILILFTNMLLGQNSVGTTTGEELAFRSVVKSMKTIQVNEINAYHVIDTLKNPEAYLLRDFENKTGTISIAIKNHDEYKVYELFSENIIFDHYVIDTVQSKKISSFDFVVSLPKVKIKSLKRIALDTFKNEELVLKFSYQRVGCIDCNQSQAHTVNGYILFDFDQLQLLKLVNFDATSLAQQLKDLENGENFKIEFRKNYVVMKKRNYSYTGNALLLN